MNEQEKVIDKKVRERHANMSKPERLKTLEVVLEQSSIDEIIDAIKLAKVTREVNDIARPLLNF